MGLFGDKQTRLNRNFRKAARGGNFAKATQLLAAGADINHVIEGRTTLYSATYAKEMEPVRFLLDNGADPNIPSGTQGHTALMEASSDGSEEIARLLVAKGANIHVARIDTKWTALHFAARRGSGSIIDLLIKNGADREVKDDKLNTPADIAAANSHARLAEHMRNKPKQEPVPVVAAKAPRGWYLTAPDEIANVSELSKIGYRLTEIFNFGASTYTRIAQNMKTGAESQTLRFFDEFSNRAALDAAEKALVSLGGKLPENTLGKPALAAPGAMP